MPAETPLTMHEQSLRRGTLKTRRLRSTPSAIGYRRFFIFAGAMMMTLGATWLLGNSLNETDGLSLLDILLLIVFFMLFGWLAFSFLGALVGFCMVIVGRGRKLGIDENAPLPELQGRTALLMPTYNEDPWRLLAGLQAIYESLATTGQLAHFDCFVLSDTRNDAIAAEELTAFRNLRERVGDASHLFYRRRTDNSGRKAGNVAEWVRRYGGAYQQMLILDADSLMTGDSIVRLAAAMEHNPDVGLIQSLPMVVNGATFFARMQQFSGHVYAPVMVRGVVWWQGAEGNYWGHNAIIRTRAFADHAGLPSLPGSKPFGGHILSHDFVEAALMRREGWAIHMVPLLGGSYEEGPPSLTDLLIRDRRWCQGNLQHGKVLSARGLHWISRCHMLIGIGGYLTAPLWALSLLLALAIPLENAGLISGGFEWSAFAPVAYWKSHASNQLLWLFGITLILLFAPKVFGYIATVLDPAKRRASGGALRIGLSVIIESAVATLMAPIVMYRQSRGIAEVIAGKDSGWEAQRRDGGHQSLRSLLRSYGGMTVFGAFIGILAWCISPRLSLWMSPIIIGMVTSIPLVALTSAVAPGQWLKRHKLLCIPEELNLPPILQRAMTLRQQHHGNVPTTEA